MSAVQTNVSADGVAVVTLDLPDSKVNVLRAAVAVELTTAFRALANQPGLTGVLLRSGKPGSFIAGADLHEIAATSVDPVAARGLIHVGHELLAAVEGLPVPTMALIDGSCLGGGLELALGFDERIATNQPRTELGLPETKIGLIPGWGGTQRLARLIGPAPACELIIAGGSLRPASPAWGLVVGETVSAEQLEDAGRRRLSNLTDWQASRLRRRQPVGLSDEEHAFTFSTLRAKLLPTFKGDPAVAEAAITAIERGCNRPLDEGLAEEAEAFLPLMQRPTARNQIAVFFLTQKHQKGPTDAASAFARVGVVGAGLMGCGIAAAFAGRDVPVTLTDSQPTARDAAAGRVAAILKDRPSAEVVVASDLSGLAGCSLVVEAVVEEEGVKRQVFRGLREVLPAGAVLASNTSTLSITRLADEVVTPTRFAGLHFFNPVDRMPLVEVIRGRLTSDGTIEQLVALARKIGKTPLVVNDGPGFLVNRVLFPYLTEAIVLLEEGADPLRVDDAARGFGMPMGPITLCDVVGLDTAKFALGVLQEAFADRAARPRVLGDLVAAGRLGQKNGAGFYHYPKGRRGEPDPKLAEFLKLDPAQARCHTSDEILDRLFLPMVTEAVRVLDDEIVASAGEVDLGMILGTGFPSWRGGPLRWADQLGLDRLVEKLRCYEALGARFAPPAGLLHRIETRTAFFSPG